VYTMTFANRGNSLWKLKTRSLSLGGHTCVMGVLNVTPDSFSDGGQHFSAEEAIAHGIAMLEQGADIVDLGGESTRPGARSPISSAMEQDRVLPVITGVLRFHPDAILSIDTYHAETAAAAVAAGAEIVNDVSGFQWDPRMAETCARLGCGVVLMHTRGKPADWKHQPRLQPKEVLPLVQRDLEERLALALASSVDPERILLDPGFGFGKSLDENYPLLAMLDSLRELGRPMMAGVSRKAFLGRTLAGLHNGMDATVGERDAASLAAMVAAILAGADVVRVHDVKPSVEAARIADAVLAASLP
jgi:dihydropteroate synthase